MFDQQEFLDLVNSLGLSNLPKLEGDVVFLAHPDAPAFRIHDPDNHYETYLVFRRDTNHIYINHWHNGELVKLYWLEYIKPETLTLKQICDSINS